MKLFLSHVDARLHLFWGIRAIMLLRNPKEPVSLSRQLYLSARAAITKYVRWGGLSNIYSLTVLETGSPRLRCLQGWFLLSPPSLAGMAVLSPCPHMVFPLCLSVS